MECRADRWRTTAGECILLAATALAALGVGCGRSTPEAKDAKSNGIESPPVDAQPSADVAPDEAVRALARGLKDRRPETFWNALPASYQNDLNTLVRDFAARLDPDVHRRSVAVARKGAGVLRSKKAFLLESPLLQQNKAVRADELAASWDGLVGLIDTLLDSELADPDRLRTFDGGPFLAATGGRLMTQLSDLSKLSPDDPFNEQLRELFSALTVKVISQDGDHAELEIDTGELESLPQRRAYLRVEGKWIPKEWAENWARNLNRAREQLRTAINPQSQAASKERTLAALTQAESVLDELAAAGDQVRFEQILSEKLVAPAVAAISAGEAARNPPAAPVKVGDDTVAVIVRPALDAAGEEAWQERLGAIADQPDLGLAIPSRAGDATTFLVSPVKNAAAYAKKIDFAQSLSVDEAGRKIMLQRKP